MIDIGSVVSGKYRLVRLLGDGGMGSVYEAVHAVLGTRVAVKVLHPELARRTGLVERFLQEARVAAQIRSPHVVQVTDVDRTPEGNAYIVMELLEGEPLSAVLDRQRRLPVSTSCEYTLQILEALEAAHALGVIHRDLKPENVFVTFAGGRSVLKLIDFGIAKARRTDPQQRNLTVAGVVMGTAEYMAPEQARSADKVDPRSDLYAVGVMLYEMIGGARPVGGEDARIIAMKVERGEVIPLVKVAPEAPRELAGLVHRAMAARPELRFASATEMRIALQQIASGKRATAGMQAASPQPPQQQPPQPEMTATGTLKDVRAQQIMAAAAAANAAAANASRPATAPARTPIASEPSDPPAAQTQRAPPIATALAPPVYVAPPVMPQMGQGNAPPAHRRRGPGTVFALIGLSLVLGAGVVGLLIATGTWAVANPDEPTSRPQPQGGQEASAPAVATTGAPTSAPIPTLSQTKPNPPQPGPRPTPSNRPGPAVEDGAAPPPPSPTPPPFVIPSTFPFQIPSAFPTVFPSVLPPWPTPPGPAPPPRSSGGSTI